MKQKSWFTGLCWYMKVGDSVLSMRFRQWVLSWGASVNLTDPKFGLATRGKETIRFDLSGCALQVIVYQDWRLLLSTEKRGAVASLMRTEPGKKGNAADAWKYCKQVQNWTESVLIINTVFFFFLTARNAWKQLLLHLSPVSHKNPLCVRKC